MRCDQAMETFTARLAEADREPGLPADPATERELEEHLESCARCRREAEQTRELWRRMEVLDVPEDRVPSAEIRRRFDTMLAGYEAARTEDNREVDRGGARLFPWRRRPRRDPAEARADRSSPRWAIAVAVVLAVVAGGVGGLAGGWWLGSRDGGSNGLEELRAEVRSLHETVALSMLEQPAATDRLRGVRFGARTTRDETVGRTDGSDRAVVAALVDIVARDPNVHVRLAAVDALAPVASDPTVRDALVRALHEQDAAIVQIALADLLLDSDGTAARRGVGALLDDPDLHPDVRRHLERRLEKRT